MISPDQATIEPLPETEFESFLRYLNDHLRDNGGEQGFFQPLPAGAGLAPARTEAMRAGLAIAVGKPGWRRAWGARALDGDLIGHIDLRGRAEPFTSHRCLLGMGVRRDVRGRGLGSRMLEYALGWAENQPTLDWVDLDVISTNSGAVLLYQRMGFASVGRLEDLFRIDGQELDSIMMSKRLRRAPR